MVAQKVAPQGDQRDGAPQTNTLLILLSWMVVLGCIRCDEEVEELALLFHSLLECSF